MADPMKVAIKVAASGIEAQSRRMLVVSENLANMHSTGKTPGADPYTRKTVSFNRRSRRPSQRSTLVQASESM